MSVWLDGRLIPSDRAAISVVDPAVQYGFGLFEVMRAYGGVPYLLVRHLARMRRSARRLLPAAALALALPAAAPAAADPATVRDALSHRAGISDTRQSRPTA